MWFRKKQPRTFDRQKQKPVLRCSICTGEETAGFRDLETGRFSEVMLVRSQKDLDEFMKEYGIDSVEREY